MEKSALLTKLKTHVPDCCFKIAEPLSQHTSFRIGGPAALMVFPSSVPQLAAVLRVLKEEKQIPLILGGGTNVLAPDAGIRQAVICLKDRMTDLRRLDTCTLEAEAGVSLARLAAFARDAGLSGLEFAHGIPGTVGGGVYMNAGAYGGEMRQVVQSVTVMESDGSLREVLCDEGTFSYRTSVFARSGSLIVRAVLRLQHGDKESIQRTMMELMEKRKASQPLELPSAGSTFKRPVGGYAAALIDEAGLRGLRVGDAAVSEKHAGFVVNLGHATSEDVQTLMGKIQKIVKDKTGIVLEPEVRIW